MPMLCERCGLVHDEAHDNCPVVLRERVRKFMDEREKVRQDGVREGLERAARYLDERAAEFRRMASEVASEGMHGFASEDVCKANDMSDLAAAIRKLKED